MVNELAEATAAPPEDTAAPVVAEPPAEQPEISAPTTDAPETVSSGDAPETEVPPTGADPFADLDDDSLRSHERVQKLVKDEAARQAESERRKSQNETARREAQRKQQYFRSAEYVGELGELLRSSARVGDDAELQISLDSRKLAAMADRVWEGASLSTYEALDAVYREQLPSDYRVPREAAERLESIRDDIYGGRKTVEDLITARLDVLREAWREQDREGDRKSIRKELRSEFEQNARNAQTKAADQKRQAEPSPTNAGSAAGGLSIGSMDEADAAYASGALSHAEYKQFREQHGIGLAPGGR